MGRIKAKEISVEATHAIRDVLIQKNLLFAQRLHDLQEKCFPKKLNNISEWAIAQKELRIILGLNEKISVDLNIETHEERVKRLQGG